MQAKEGVRLHYFPIRGAGQPIRNLLYFLEVPFEDVGHGLRGDEVEVGFNLGLPMLEDGALRIHETIAIVIYLCRKYERPQLLGLTPQSIARTQEILMKYYVQRKRIVGHLLEALGGLASRGEKEIYVEGQLRRMAADCKFIEFCLKGVEEGREYVQEGITLVDFFFYEQCFYIQGFFGEHIDREGPFGAILEFKERFERLPFFEKNAESIGQKCLFHEFKNPEMNRMIREFWKGGKCGTILLQPSLE